MRAKRSIGIEDWGDDIAIPMNPVHGMWSFVPGQEVPLGGSPDMMNCVVRASLLTKRPGYSGFPAGMAAIGTRVMGLYSTQDAENNTYLYAAHPTGLAVLTTLAGGWGAVTGAALTGSSEKLFNFETSQNSVVFSQGVDQVMKAVFGAGYAILNASCPPAYYLSRWADRIFLGRTFETTSQPFRVRRPVASDHTDWTGLGSGFTDMVETPFHLRGLKKLSSQLAVYAEKAIYMGTRTELAEAPARYQIQVTDIGLYAPYTLKGRNELHYFMGNDDVYMFNGAQIQSLGWQVRESIFPVLNIAKIHMMFGEITFDTQEYLLFLCTGSSLTPDRVWVHNWAREIWYPWSVSGPCCSTVHRLDTGVTIDSIDQTIDSQTYEIDSLAAQADYPALVTGHTDGKVYKWSKAYLSDNGVAIPCRWASKDFTAKDIQGKYDEKIILKAVHVRYKETGAAATLAFWYSVNGGASWIGPDNMTLLAGTSGYAMASVYRQVTGDQIRVKFENNTTTEDFQIVEIIPVFETPGSKVSV